MPAHLRMMHKTTSPGNETMENPTETAQVDPAVGADGDRPENGKAYTEIYRDQGKDRLVKPNFDWFLYGSTVLGTAIVTAIATIAISPERVRTETKVVNTTDSGAKAYGMQTWKALLDRGLAEYDNKTGELHLRTDDQIFVHLKAPETFPEPTLFPAPQSTPKKIK